MSNQNELRVIVNDFEGPLDVLLHLIKETKMDIQEVPMLVIVDQYLAFIRDMETMQLDVAGDYLVMAATLLEIKSRLLLPRVETLDEFVEEDDENLEEALKQQLIDYQKFKNVALLLREKEIERGQFFAKEPTNLDALQDSVPLQEGELQLEDVLLAFQKMFEKKAQQQPLQAKIGMSVISVEETMATILTTLATANTQGVALEDIVTTRDTLIPSFLAMLELSKTKKIVFKQSTPYEPIKLFKGSQFDSAEKIEITSGV